jgi:hypothetical protein
MVGRLVKSNAVGARGGTHAAGLLLGVELKIANEIIGMVVEAGEMLRCRVLQRY